MSYLFKTFKIPRSHSLSIIKITFVDVGSVPDVRDDSEGLPWEKYGSSWSSRIPYQTVDNQIASCLNVRIAFPSWRVVNNAMDPQYEKAEKALNETAL